MPSYFLNIGKSWCVYRHISPSGKVYIGITSMKITKRWGAGSGYKSQVLFYRAIKKYGWKSFKHQVMFSGLTEEKAKDLEKKLIGHYKKLKISYNVTDGGEGILGFQFSEVSKIKMRESHIGKKLSEEQKRKIRESNKGRKASKAFLDYIATRTVHPMLGKHHTKKAKAIISEVSKRNWLERDKESIRLLGKLSGKEIVQLSLDGEILNYFPSAAEAARKLKINRGNITSCCLLERKTAGGYKWKYNDKLCKP